MKKLLVILSVVAASGSWAQAGEKKAPIEEYESATVYALFMCQMKAKIAESYVELGKPGDESSDVSGCIDSQSKEARLALDKAVRSARKPALREALKAHHVVFIGALRGIRPVMDERVISYERRQADNKQRLTEAWAKVEVEM